MQACVIGVSMHGQRIRLKVGTKAGAGAPWHRAPRSAKLHLIGVGDSSLTISRAEIWEKCGVISSIDYHGLTP